MKIFKFGGASISTIENIKKVASIVADHQSEQIWIVASAMGKTTNALELVAEAFFAQNKDEALRLFSIIKQDHLIIAEALLAADFQKLLHQLMDFFTEVEWLLHDKPVRDFDYYYDQIVCIGEMLSSSILSAYFTKLGIKNIWLDVRDIIKTDENFRDASIDMETTSSNLSDLQSGFLSDDGAFAKIYITQGFVGSTVDNESTTLGREGSDYSAAIFASLLQAESVTIWKDVEGVMSGDPKVFKDATLLQNLSFNEVIEMAYYGAKVIHPKTIKPLQNAQIPMMVKSFFNPSHSGTLINHHQVKFLPPIKIVKQNQVLLTLKSLDFSFVGDDLIKSLFEIFATLHIKPNLLQIGAISAQVCIDDVEEKLNWIATAASNMFDVQVERNLTLLTIRHYKADAVDEILKDKNVVLLQRTKETMQALYRDEQ